VPRKGGTTFRLPAKHAEPPRRHQAISSYACPSSAANRSSAEQKENPGRLRRVSGDANEPTSKSFFEKAKKFF